MEKKKRLRLTMKDGSTVEVEEVEISFSSMDGIVGIVKTDDGKFHFLDAYFVENDHEYTFFEVMKRDDQTWDDVFWDDEAKELPTSCLVVDLKIVGEV